MNFPLILHKNTKLIFLTIGATASLIFFVQGMMIPLPSIPLLILLSYLILCIPLCAFIGILVRDIYKKSFTKSISFIVGFIMVPLLYITIAFGIPALYTSVYHIKFESPAWQEQHEILEQEDSISSIRLGMMDSLFKKHRLAGMSRTEIKLLLGKPEAYSIMGYEYAYTLGIKNFFFPHTSVMGLGINFEDDVVVEMGAFVFL